MTRYLWPGRGAFLLFLGLLAALILASGPLTARAAFTRHAGEAAVLDVGRLLGYYLLFSCLFYALYCGLAAGWRRLQASR